MGTEDYGDEVLRPYVLRQGRWVPATSVSSGQSTLEDRVCEIRDKWENPDCRHDKVIRREFDDLFEFLDLLICAVCERRISTPND